MRLRAPTARLDIALGRRPRLRDRLRKSKATSLTAGTTGVVQLCNILTGIVTARALGVSGRGELAIALLVPSLITYLGDLGLPLALTYFSAGMPVEATLIIRRQAVSLALGLAAVLVLVATPVDLLYVGARARHVAFAALIYLTGFLPLNLITRFLNAIEQGAQQFIRFNLVRVIVPASYTVLLILTLVFGWLTVSVALFVAVVSNAAGAAFLWRRDLRPARIDQGTLRRWIGFGARAHLGHLTPTDAMQLDLLLVGAALGAHDAGIYAVASGAAMFVRGQGISVGLTLYPRLVASSYKSKRAIMQSGLLATAAFEVALAVPIVAMAPWAVREVYGRDFAGASLIMRILVCGAVAAGLRHVAGSSLRGLGSPGIASLNELWGWVVGVPLALLGLKFDGLAGVAMGVSFTYVVTLVLNVSSLCKLDMSKLDKNAVRLDGGPNRVTSQAGLGAVVDPEEAS